MSKGEEGEHTRTGRAGQYRNGGESGGNECLGHSCLATAVYPTYLPRDDTASPIAGIHGCLHCTWYQHNDDGGSRRHGRL
jgi:hypothetical protein